MDGYRTLSLDAALELDGISVSRIRPYEILFSPIYLFMQRNKKFVCIRNTLDFFSPIDLIKIKTVDQLYQPKAASEVEGFISMARRIVKIMEWEQRPLGPQNLPPASYEISKQVMQVLREVWKEKSPQVNLLGLTALAQEICGPLTSDVLEETRSGSIENYELGLLRSGLGVCAALHLGYVDRAFIKTLRDQLFINRDDRPVSIPGGSEVQEIADLGLQMITSGEKRIFELSELINSDDVAARKFKQRVEGGLVA